MPFIANRNYSSEASDFLNQLKKDHPELEAQQREGRALLWDKTVDLNAQQDFAAAKVAQSAYVYQTQASN